MKSKDRLHLAKVASLSCIVCRNIGFSDSPAECHHIRTGAGMGQRSAHDRVLPLCHTHHRTGGYGVAIHAGRKEWERLYGTELELLEQVRSMIENIL